MTTDTGTFDWSDAGPADSAGILGVDPGNLYNRWYGKGEYILWKIRNSSLPSLQLTVPYTSSALDQLQTNIDIPGGDIDYGARSGGRLTLGYWCDLDHNLGVEASFFQIEGRQAPFFVNQLQNTPLNVTIQQNITQQLVVGTTVTTQTVQVPLDIILPAVLTVTANGQIGPTEFWGGELSARSTHCYFGPAVFDFIGGFRYINLDESFSLNETISMQTANPSTITVAGPVTTTGGALVDANGVPVQIPTAISGLQTLFSTVSTNQILTYNRFYGANVGASFECWCTPRLFFSGFGKVSVGAVTQEARVNNFTSTTSGAAGTIATPGGVFTPVQAQLSYARTRYAFAPEFNLNVGMQLTSRCRATLGYNLLYITSVMRPADQLVFGNSTTAVTIAGTANTVPITQPTFSYTDAEFYAQGLVAGLEFRY